MNLPDSFLQKTGRLLTVTRPDQGMNSDVTMLTAEHGRFALKQAVTEKQIATVAAESRILAAIGHEYPFVPAPVAADETRLLMTWLPGKDLTALLPELGAADCHRLMQESAAALRRIHTWRPDLPPPPDALLRFLHAHEIEPEICFTHSDYCLPNIMVDGGHVSAVIDWPHAGYSDWRIDLAGVVKSIRRNLHAETYVETFLQAYGYRGGDLAVFHQAYDLFS